MSKIRFQEHWLTEFNWVKEGSIPGYATCTICQKNNIYYATMGRSSLTSHMKGKKHVEKVKNVLTQTFFPKIHPQQLLSPLLRNHLFLSWLLVRLQHPDSKLKPHNLLQETIKGKHNLQPCRRTKNGGKRRINWQKVKYCGVCKQLSATFLYKKPKAASTILGLCLMTVQLLKKWN